MTGSGVRTDCFGFVPQPRNDEGFGARTDCHVLLRRTRNDGVQIVIANVVKRCIEHAVVEMKSVVSSAVSSYLLAHLLMADLEFQWSIEI